MPNPWPTISVVNTTNLDEDTDSVSVARGPLALMVASVNGMISALNTVGGVPELSIADGGRPKLVHAGLPNWATAYRTSLTTTSLGNNTFNFQSNISDTTGFINLGSQPTRITIPSKTPAINAVKVIANCQIAPPSQGSPPSPSLRYVLNITLNGGGALPINSTGSANITQYNRGRVFSNDVNDYTVLYLSTPKIYVSAGDYFELVLNNPNSGAPQAQYLGFMSVMVAL